MDYAKVECSFCGKEFLRRGKRLREAEKFGWKQYCSSKCLSKDRIKKLRLVCDNCGKTFERSLHEVSPHYNYCSSSCAAVVNNKKYPKRHSDSGFLICLRCGRKFRKSSKKLRYCSIKCRGEAEYYSREKLLKIIKLAYRRLKRVPSRRELKIDKACRRFFGSWNKAVAAAGFQPNRSHSQRMYKRMNGVAIDGHICDSVSEVLIDNWLSKNSIPHEKNALYPGTNYRADWVVSTKYKIFIEYFGLAHDSPRYDQAIKEKQKLCQKSNLRLIEIYPQDIYPQKNLSAKLRNKFQKLI
ncbi:MAG: hypothetical protein V1838_03940 [Patescibacteria group bacterium]